MVDKEWVFLRFDSPKGDAPAPLGEATIRVTDADDPDNSLTRMFTVGGFYQDFPNSDLGGISVYRSDEEITQSLRSLSEDLPSVTESHVVPGWTCELLIEVGNGEARGPRQGRSTSLRTVQRTAVASLTSSGQRPSCWSATSAHPQARCRSTSSGDRGRAGRG